MYDRFFDNAFCGKFFSAIFDFFKLFVALFSSALVVVVLVERGYAIFGFVKQKIVVVRHSDHFFSVYKDDVFVLICLV